MKPGQIRMEEATTKTSTAVVDRNINDMRPWRQTAAAAAAAAAAATAVAPPSPPTAQQTLISAVTTTAITPGPAWPPNPSQTPTHTQTRVSCAPQGVDGKLPVNFFPPVQKQSPPNPIA